ncbi:uncharacterized protein BO87DRAFT_304700 [Aspergillus neoniger CBS 115656]|uniref:Uncharacterized protein n=1 Tax=Aspergillus neoniger (strain CBS 115656) TaxID=1448310 RepID=A0A318YVI0_ASPNB|nr:hypothetical protein BO87DRAFT_304700 [Aspergillus neoniger CBS 115656]PYH35930.1 hypothetical protein BO87DRAFT_304700 [Aspergillus neoniger CBS 115656]
MVDSILVGCVREDLSGHAYEQMHRYSFPGRSTSPVWYTSSNARGENRMKAEER